MNKNDLRISIEDNSGDFFYLKSKSKLNISFNRIAFIFFIFFIISIIYSIHLAHLGSRKSNTEDYTKKKNINKQTL